MNGVRGVRGIRVAALALAAALVAPGIAQATYPGENGKIYFSANAFDTNTMTASGTPDVWSANPDGTGLVNLTDLPGGPGQGYDPSVSADGTRVVFYTGSQATAEIWIMNADGSSPQQLTFPAADPLDALDHMPAISPDGSQIAFGTTRETAPMAPALDFDIWLMNSDGSNPQPLIHGTGESYSPTWTPDGQKVVAATEVTGDLGIGSVPPTGGPFTAAGVTIVVDEDAPIREVQPSVSPDGNRVAYTRSNGAATDVYTADFGGANQVPVAADPVNESDPSYSPDGTKIAYARNTLDGEIIIANADGSEAAALPVDPNVAVFEATPEWAVKQADPEPPADTTPPETTITKKPKKKSTKRKAKFRFESNEEGSTFECKLDKKAFAPCTSPRKIKRLKVKRHKFLVRATDAAGNPDPTPAKAKFKVVEES